MTAFITFAAALGIFDPPSPSAESLTLAPRQATTRIGAKCQTSSDCRGSQRDPQYCSPSKGNTCYYVEFISDFSCDAPDACNPIKFRCIGGKCQEPKSCSKQNPTCTNVSKCNVSTGNCEPLGPGKLNEPCQRNRNLVNVDFCVRGLVCSSSTDRCVVNPPRTECKGRDGICTSNSNCCGRSVCSNTLPGFEGRCL